MPISNNMYIISIDTLSAYSSPRHCKELVSHVHEIFHSEVCDFNATLVYQIRRATYDVVARDTMTRPHLSEQHGSDYVNFVVWGEVIYHRHCQLILVVFPPSRQF